MFRSHIGNMLIHSVPVQSVFGQIKQTAEFWFFSSLDFWKYKAHQLELLPYLWIQPYNLLVFYLL